MILITMLPILLSIILLILPFEIRCEEVNRLKNEKSLSNVRRRDQWFGASVLMNGYCGTSEADASSRCILCRDQTECTEGEQCILLEDCGTNFIYGEYQVQEPEIQSGYCAPSWLDAAKCSYQDLTCTADDECSKKDGHSCFYSIDWCVPGQVLQTFFCATDLDDAQKCEQSKQCYSEYDLCDGEGESCIETDTCSVVAFETSSPTEAFTNILKGLVLSDSPTSSPTAKTTNPEVEATQLPSPSNSCTTNKVNYAILSILVSCLIITALHF